jgi:hypothetical protein
MQYGSSQIYSSSEISDPSLSSFSSLGGSPVDVEHPTDITMPRVRLASDMCKIYFKYIKVNHLLYTCSLDPLEDRILLDTPLLCMHRYYRSTTDDKEECKRKCTPIPSKKEARKRTQKKGEEHGAATGARSDVRVLSRIIRALVGSSGRAPGSSGYSVRRHPKAPPRSRIMRDYVQIIRDPNRIS